MREEKSSYWSLEQLEGERIISNLKPESVRNENP
jgi:hypothetical protein